LTAKISPPILPYTPIIGKEILIKIKHPNRFRRGLAAALALGLAYIVTACATTPKTPDYFPTKGAPHTITYTDKETGKEVTAFDLTGDWEAQYRSGKEIVRVQVVWVVRTGDRGFISGKALLV